MLHDFHIMGTQQYQAQTLLHMVFLYQYQQQEVLVMQFLLRYLKVMNILICIQLHLAVKMRVLTLHFLKYNNF